MNKDIRLVMGPDCEIQWTKVDVIPLTPQGKHKYTLSEIVNKAV